MSLHAQKLRSRQLQCVVNIQTRAQLPAVLCIACGADTGPKSRDSFSAGSKRALEPRGVITMFCRMMQKVKD